MLQRLLQKRSNTYYFRWVFPIHIRLIVDQRELYKSLATSDIWVARVRAGPFFRFVAFVKGLNMNLLTTEQFQTLIRDAWEQLRCNRLQQEYNPDDAHGYDYGRDDFYGHDRERDQVHDLLWEKNALYEHWNPLIGKFDIHIPPRLVFKDPQRTIEWEDEFGDYFEYHMRKWGNLFKSCGVDRHLFCQRDQLKLLNELLKLKAEDLEERIGLALRGGSAPACEPMATLPDHLNNKSSKSSRAVERKVSAETRAKSGADLDQTLSQMWAEFKSEKLASQSWSDQKAIQTRDTWFSEFLLLCGGDRSPKNFARKDVIHLLEQTRQVPSFWGRRYKHIPLKDVPSTAARIADKTVEDRMNLFSEFFKWMVRCDYLPKSPFDGVGFKAKNQSSYATYTKEDLEELFNLPPKRILHNWQFWIPRLALYTGARQAEIAQLRVDDVKQYTSGDWYISINDEDGKSVKTEAAIRFVPLHKELIANGFLEHVESVRRCGIDSLWPDLRPKSKSLGQQVSSYWNETLKVKHKIPSKPVTDDGRRKVFHSLRRVFINKLIDAQVGIGIIQSLVGHEPELIGETKTYIDDLTPATYQRRMEAVNQFNPGAEISWDNPKPL